MSLIKANSVQIGQSGTATQNFTLAVPSSPDGTIKLARGNAGATTQDVLSVDASGNINGLVKSTGSTTARSLANRFADVVNVLDFGAVGDWNGTTGTDNSIAWANFLAFLNTSGKIGFIPEGKYYIPTAPGTVVNPTTSSVPQLTNYGNIVIYGEGEKLTTLVAKKETISPGSNPASRAILKIVSCESFSLSDITLDGGFTSNPATLSGWADKDAAALLEVRDCNNVKFNNVTTKGFYGHRPSNTVSNNNAGNFGRSGPILIANCTNGIASNLRIEYPTWREGIFFFNCQNFTIDGFKYIGPIDRTNGSLSTPLNIFGPTTEKINLSNSSFTGAWSGSVLNMGGAGSFNISNFIAKGNISDVNDTTGDPRTLSGTTTWGKGIDLGAEHQEDTFTSHPELKYVNINNVILLNMFSYSLRIIKQDTTPAKHIIINNICVDNSFEGINLQNNQDVNITNASCTKILQYVSVSDSNGFAYKFSKCKYVKFDGYCAGGETATYSYPNTTVITPILTPMTVFSRIGISIDKCENLFVKATIKDFKQYHLFYDVDVPADDNLYDGSFEITGIAETYTTPAGLIPDFYVFGRSATQRLETLQIFNSLYNNLPLIQNPFLSYFAANSLFQAQNIPLGNPNSVLVQDENLGKITFYNGDVSSSQSGVRSSIESNAADSIGRGAYISFKTSSIANPLTESFRMNSTGSVRYIPTTTPASPSAGDVFYNSATNTLRLYNGTSWFNLTMTAV
jgi:hypothetical protein